MENSTNEMPNGELSQEYDGQEDDQREPRNRIFNKLNLILRGVMKQKGPNSIILVVPDLPISVYLDHVVFLFSIPNGRQISAPVYVRLQDDINRYGVDGAGRVDEAKIFTEVKSTGYLKQTKRGRIIVCAPTTHVRVDLEKTVIIAAIPNNNRDFAPCYIKPKTFKNEPSYQVESVVPNEPTDPPPASTDIDETSWNTGGIRS
jgi:hypothetical protein